MPYRYGLTSYAWQTPASMHLQTCRQKPNCQRLNSFPILPSITTQNIYNHLDVQHMSLTASSRPSNPLRNGNHEQSWDFTLVHARNVALVLDLQTRLVSPQFHVTHDPSFITVRNDTKKYNWNVRAGLSQALHFSQHNAKQKTQAPEPQRRPKRSKYHKMALINANHGPTNTTSVSAPAAQTDPNPHETATIAGPTQAPVPVNGLHDQKHQSSG